MAIEAMLKPIIIQIFNISFTLWLRTHIICRACSEINDLMKNPFKNTTFLFGVTKTKNLPNVQKWLNHTKPAVDYLKAKPKFTKRVDMTELTQQNVLLQIQNLITHPCVVEKLKIGSIDIHGWVYDIGQGSIKVFDESTNLFISFEQFYSNLLK